MRSSTLPARAGERLPALSSPAREEARFPPAPRTRDTGPRAAWPIVQTSRVVSPLLSGTILSLPPAAHRPLAQHPHSPSLSLLPPRTVAAHLVLPRRGDLATTMASAQTDPNAAFKSSSQPPSSGCCDDHLVRSIFPIDLVSLRPSTPARRRAFNCLGSGRPSPVRSSSSRARLLRNKAHSREMPCAKSSPLIRLTCSTRSAVRVLRSRQIRRRSSSYRQVDNPLHGVGRQRLFAGPARLVARQPFDALCHEPRLPSPYHRLRFARSANNLGRAAAVGRGEDDVGAPRCGALRSNTIASSRWRSARVTFTTIPALMSRA